MRVSNMAGKKFFALLIIVSAGLALIALFAPGSQADDQSVELAVQAKEILTRRCYQCHGKNGVANKNIFVLDRERLLGAGVLLPGNAESLLLKMIESDAMPLGGPPLAAKEKASLRNWILSGAPDWNPPARQSTAEPNQTRAFIPESTILALIERDLAQASERSRPYLRYFTISHLYNARVSDEDLNEYRIGLAKLLNSLSWHREISLPQPIDQAQTILRIDLRDYNWTANTWRLILAVYPYGVRVPANQIICQLSGAELPYVRADWFVANASIPPLYHDLLELPKTVYELERQLGVDVSRNLMEERNVVRAGIRNSGVSQNNRVVERHNALYGSYWRSYDFRSNLDDQNIFKDPINLHPAGGEIIFNLPNGMQAYYLANGQGQRLNSAPIEIVADRNFPDDPVIHNGRSCMSCHYGGIKPFHDDVRAVLESEHNEAIPRDHHQMEMMEKGLAIYSKQESLDRLIKQDQERFRRSIEQAGGKLSENVQSEPINALARRFNAELTLSLASAETGLDLDEFQARLRGSNHLTTLGYNQLLVPQGGLKRDNWEKHYADLTRELHLGDPVIGLSTNPVIVQNTTAVISTNHAVNSTISAPVSSPHQANSAARTPIDMLRTAQKIFIFSKSGFFKAEAMESEFNNNKEFQAMELFLLRDMHTADLVIELDRPVFTYTFTYTITDRNSSVVLATGKVIAINGDSAAVKLSKEIVKKFQQARQNWHPNGT